MKSSDSRSSGDLDKQGSGVGNTELLKWWGGMLESLGEESMDKALECVIACPCAYHTQPNCNNVASHSDVDPYPRHNVITLN
jgi:hypothetical protein